MPGASAASNSSDSRAHRSTITSANAVARCAVQRSAGPDTATDVITHAHPDHVQGAADLRHRTGADILVHAADRPRPEAGRVPPEGRSGLPGRLLDRLPKLHWTPVTADGTLVDGDLVDGAGGLRVIHTPGHIVLWHEPSRTLLTGDADFHRGRLDLGHAALAADPGLRAESLAILPADVRAVGFAHGAPLTGAGAETFRRFVESL